MNFNKNNFRNDYASEDSPEILPLADDLGPSPNTPTERLDTLSTHSFTNDNESGEKLQKVSFWKRYRVSLIISGVLLLLLIIGGVLAYVFLPKLAQTFMNGASMSIQQIRISQPQEAGFLTQIQGKISNAGPFSASTQPMQMQVIFQGQPIGKMEMPGLDLKNGAVDLNVTTPFTIVNKTAFDNFSLCLVSKKEFTWEIVGSTNLTVLGMKIPNLKFDKSLTLSGINSLPGVKLQSFNLFSQDPKFINISISTEMTNPSQIALDIGDVDFDMNYDGQYIGTVSASNVTMNTGLNNIDMSGQLKNTAINGSTAQFDQLFSNYVTGQTSLIEASGSPNSTRNATWLTYALSNLNITIGLDPPSVTQQDMIQKISFEGMSMDFSNQSDILQPSMQVLNVTVDFNLPFKFPLQIQSISQNIKVFKNNTLLAHFSTPMIAASNAQNQSIINTYLPKTQMQIDNAPGFSNFLGELFQSSDESFVLDGVADVVANTALGLLTLKGVEFQQEIPVLGMQQLHAIKQDGRTSNPVITSVEVLKGETDQMIMQTDLILYSPSNVGVNLGNVTLFLYFENQPIGYSPLINLIVNPGDNKISCQTIFNPSTPEAQVAGTNMITNYVNQRPSQLVMVGDYTNSTTNTILSKSISQLSLTAPMQGLSESLVKKASIYLNPFTVAFTKNAQTSFTASNPFGDTFEITEMNASIEYQGNQMAQVNSTGLSIVIPPHTTAETSKIPVKLLNFFGKTTFSALGSDIKNNLAVNVTSKITGKVGSYAIAVEYDQLNLPASVKL